MVSACLGNVAELPPIREQAVNIVPLALAWWCVLTACVDGVR
jgi:hypothetical protein